MKKIILAALIATAAASIQAREPCDAPAPPGFVLVDKMPNSQFFVSETTGETMTSERIFEPVTNWEEAWALLKKRLLVEELGYKATRLEFEDNTLIAQGSGRAGVQFHAMYIWNDDIVCAATFQRKP